MDFSKYSVVGIIPSRYASSRFPGKPLALINGLSMIQRVYYQAKACQRLSDVIVATDDTRIYDHVINFGGRAMMTSPNHPSGTHRVIEVVDKLIEQNENYHIVVNIQGDEPFIQPTQIESVVDIFDQHPADVGTLVKRIDSKDELFDPNVVKVVIDSNNRAMYFSRQTIPYVRGVAKDSWINNHTFYKHIGIYAYLTNTLHKLIKLDPAPTELAESLEQLRWLYAGFNVFTQFTEIDTIGIDTPEDLSKLINIPC